MNYKGYNKQAATTIVDTLTHDPDHITTPAAAARGGITDLGILLGGATGGVAGHGLNKVLAATRGKLGVLSAAPVLSALLGAGAGGLIAHDRADKLLRKDPTVEAAAKNGKHVAAGIEGALINGIPRNITLTHKFKFGEDSQPSDGKSFFENLGDKSKQLWDKLTSKD